MRPTKIPDDKLWAGARKIDIGVTKDQKAQGIGALEGVYDVITGGTALDGTPRTQIRMLVEPKDLEDLQKNPHIWIAFLGVAGGIYPFSIATEETPNTASESIELEEKLRTLVQRLRDEALSEHFNLKPEVRTAHSAIADILEAILNDTIGAPASDEHETKDHPWSAEAPPDPSQN